MTRCFIDYRLFWGSVWLWLAIIKFQSFCTDQFFKAAYCVWFSVTLFSPYSLRREICLSSFSLLTSLGDTSKPDMTDLPLQRQARKLVCTVLWGSISVDAWFQRDLLIHLKLNWVNKFILQDCKNFNTSLFSLMKK